MIIELSLIGEGIIARIPEVGKGKTRRRGTGFYINDHKTIISEQGLTYWGIAKSREDQEFPTFFGIHFGPELYVNGVMVEGDEFLVGNEDLGIKIRKINGVEENEWRNSANRNKLTPDEPKGLFKRKDLG